MYVCVRQSGTWSVGKNRKRRKTKLGGHTWSMKLREFMVLGLLAGRREEKERKAAV